MDNTVENLAKNVGQQAQQKGNVMVDKLSETAHKAEEMFKQASEQVQQNAGDINKAIISYVKEKPFTALGFAIGAGLLLGAALRK